MNSLLLKLTISLRCLLVDLPPQGIQYAGPLPIILPFLLVKSRQVPPLLVVIKNSSLSRRVSYLYARQSHSYGYDTLALQDLGVIRLVKVEVISMNIYLALAGSLFQAFFFFWYTAPDH